MHTEHRAALGASPLLVFVFDEVPDAEFLDAYQILYRTRSILGLIALI